MKRRISNSASEKHKNPHSLMVERILDIFRLRREERIPTAVVALFFTVMNVLNVCAYWSEFSIIDGDYHKRFVGKYLVSGFDPLTYQVISDWYPVYNIYRHPLLAFFMYPFGLLNKALMWLTGVNCATPITAFILTVCVTYSFVFLYRILRNVVGIGKMQTYALAALYFSFGFIMLSAMVPDHFVMSQCCLLLTLWLGGEKLKRGSALNMWQTVALFILTAGVSLNNGLKVFLAALVTRRRRFFRPGYLALAVILPSAIIWGLARWEYQTWEFPKYKARMEVKNRKEREATERLRKTVADTISIKTDSAVAAEVKRIRQERAVAKYRADHKKIWNVNTGKPIAKGEFMNWTDITTSRTDVAIHNLFGEAIQLHSENALGDVLRNRPLIVKYTGVWAIANYLVEALVVALFVVGIWYGRHRLFLWTAMSFFLMDMALHMGLGFGINEIYIMSAHYLFVVPIAMAYVIKGNEKKGKAVLLFTGLVSLLAAWCFLWNMTVICNYIAL